MNTKSFWGLALDDYDESSQSDESQSKKSAQNKSALRLSRSIHVTKAAVTGVHRLQNPEFVDVAVLITLESQKKPMEICTILGKKGFEVPLDLYIKKGERIIFNKRNYSKSLNNPEVQLSGYYLEAEEEKDRDEVDVTNKVKVLETASPLPAGGLRKLNTGLESINSELGKMKKEITKMDEVKAKKKGKKKKEKLERKESGEEGGNWRERFNRMSLRRK